MTRSSGCELRTHASASGASASTSMTAWLDLTLASGEPPNAFRSSAQSASQSWSGSAEKSVSLLVPGGAGFR